jgi:putative phosphoesterase
MLVGLISDTHGLLRAEAVAALAGADIIIHAGDVGGDTILPALRRIAPVHAVRGNVDAGPWAEELPEVLEVVAGAHRLHVVHRLQDLAIDPETAGISAVIYGHSHKPMIERYGHVLLLNPGSAGPRRFSLPVTIGRLVLDGDTLRPEIVELSVEAVTRTRAKP